MQSAKRIAVLFPGALGDLLLLAPALAAVAARGTIVTLSVRRELTELAALLVGSAAGPPVDGRAASTLFGPTLDEGLALWLRGTDALHAWLGAAATAVLAAHARGLGIARLYVHAVLRGDAAEHAPDAYGRMLGIDPPLPTTSVALGERPSPVAWGVAPPFRLVVHPGSGGAPKRWSSSGFETVASGWRDRGGEVAVLLGPAEAGEVARWRSVGDHLVHGVSVIEAAALIASAPRWLGNDSGVSHLAGALARRGVVLFGPTRAARWRPHGGDLKIVDFAHSDEQRVVDAVLGSLGSPG